jgi:hypothetical protein
VADAAQNKAKSSVFSSDGHKTGRLGHPWSP